MTDSEKKPIHKNTPNFVLLARQKEENGSKNMPLKPLNLNI